MEGLTTYVWLTAALVITPGATTAVVASNTLASGWRGGLGAAAGAALGNSTHATLAGLGAAVLLARSPIAMHAVRIAGGLFLLWLALSSARRLFTGHALPGASALPASADRAVHHAWREGLSVNLLNPAIITFYLTVVPSFLPSPAPRGRYVLLSAIHVTMAFAMHAVWVGSLHRLRTFFQQPAARLALEALTTVAMAALAWRVLV